jgi:glycosyltransferase involved in cell wall biosynthesis
VAVVGIVYPRANLDTVPCLTVAAEMLAEHGYSVDLFTYLVAGQAPPRFDQQRVRLRPLGTQGVAEASTAAVRDLARRADWLRRSGLRTPLARGYAAVGAGLAQGSRLLARARSVDRPAYRCLIGVDPDGLALAHSLGRGAPVAYYSLELLLSEEITDASDARRKDQELRLSRQAPFVVVQDPDRARLLIDDNDLDPQRVLLVPNAPRGPARRQRSDVWRRRFGLAADARIVLHAGSLGDWTGIEDILDSVATWPEPWVLVVHTRYDAESSAYVDRLRARATPGRVFFSLKPVSRADYDQLIDGADLGLAFYVPIGDSPYTRQNIQTIGLSSGKLAYYLRAGLPVIVNTAASVAALIENEGCGRAVATAGEIGHALDEIAADERGYCEAALAFFDRHLDVARAFASVIERIDAL